MNWSKTEKKYSVECTKNGTTFNLDGLIVKQPVMTQSQAVEFLNLNGFKGFEIDPPKTTKKTTTKKL